MPAAIAASPLSRARALAFGLGVALAILGAGLAHGQTLPAPAPEQIAQGLLPPLPNDSFVCWTRTGEGCDLRDWRRFAAHPVAAGRVIGR